MKELKLSSVLIVLFLLLFSGKLAFSLYQNYASIQTLVQLQQDRDFLFSEVDRLVKTKKTCSQSFFDTDIGAFNQDESKQVASEKLIDYSGREWKKIKEIDQLFEINGEPHQRLSSDAKELDKHLHFSKGELYQLRDNITDKDLGMFRFVAFFSAPLSGNEDFEVSKSVYFFTQEDNQKKRYCLSRSASQLSEEKVIEHFLQGRGKKALSLYKDRMCEMLYGRPCAEGEESLSSKISELYSNQLKNFCEQVVGGTYLPDRLSCQTK